MSSIAEYRRVLELEGRLDRLETRLAELEGALTTVMTLYTELEVRLDTPRSHPNSTQQRRA